MKSLFACVLALLALAMLPSSLFAGGGPGPGSIASQTATATGGETEANLDGRGAHNISQVKKNGIPLTAGVDYELEGDGTSSPTVAFTGPLAAGDIVKVTYSFASSRPATTMELN